MKGQDNINVFLDLLKSGLWEVDARLTQYNHINFEEIYCLAENQTVIGLITAGLEHVLDYSVPKEHMLQFVGSSLQLEQINMKMNSFLEKLIGKMQGADIYALLVKGQGIAQCYERPLWRASGDIDLFLNETNYQKAIRYLLPLSSNHDDELEKEQHFALIIDGWIVELHGSLPSRISVKADKVLEDIQHYVFCGGSVSLWRDGKTKVFLLHPNENVVYVFTHIIKHFFRGGIGLRQICDWCRLIWANRKSIDEELLMKRLKAMGFVSEWKAFASLAVDVLGMPSEAMPFYTPSRKWRKKANSILDYIMTVGNFGHNRDNSFRTQQPFLKRKWIAFCYKMNDFICHFEAFPLDSIKVFVTEVKSGVVYTLRHEG